PLLRVRALRVCEEPWMVIPPSALVTPLPLMMPLPQLSIPLTVTVPLPVRVPPRVRFVTVALAPERSAVLLILMKTLSLTPGLPVGFQLLSSCQSLDIMPVKVLSPASPGLACRAALQSNAVASTYRMFVARTPNGFRVMTCALPFSLRNQPTGGCRV